jgi:hypothetical protein
MIDGSLFSSAKAEPITAMVGVASRGIPYSYVDGILPAGIYVSRKQGRRMGVWCEFVHVIKWVSAISQSCKTGRHILLVESDHMWQARWTPRTFRWVLHQVCALFRIQNAHELHIEVSRLPPSPPPSKEWFWRVHNENFAPHPRLCVYVYIFGSVVVKALCYKPEGSGFESR